VARKTIDEVFDEARGQIARLAPHEALRALSDGAVLIDLRSADERERHGVVPGAVHIPRSVLEWRVDPDCEHRNPAVARLDARLVLFCADGYSSVLAAVSLQQLGFARASDVIGGFAAWKAAGLPVGAAGPHDPTERPGMGRPDSAIV
jgi:rhodanese-related sulfurtransferase